ncbi:MAG: hypothetical protein IPP45_09825 [Sphingomonadales bacterium]|nr:hypothetical protein [Sphingomonadales bacterium]
MNFFTVSGVAATRHSPAAASAGQAILITLAADQDDNDRTYDKRSQSTPLEEAHYALIGFAVRLHVAIASHVFPLDSKIADRSLSQRSPHSQLANAPSAALAA